MKFPQDPDAEKFFVLLRLRNGRLFLSKLARGDGVSWIGRPDFLSVAKTYHFGWRTGAISRAQTQNSATALEKETEQVKDGSV